MPRLRLLVLLLALAACAERYSPDTYATRAVQQANKVEPGAVIGVRKVQISAEGSTGAAAGAAAGGVLGAQTPGGGIGQALGGVGGALVGGLIGKATESATVDTPAFEYIVRTEKDELLSVTQKDTVPLAIGQKVLVITGTQARVVPDYTVATGPRPPARDAAAPPAARDAAPAGASEAKPAPAVPEDPAAAAAAAVLQQVGPAVPGPPVLVPAPPTPRAGPAPGAAVPAIAGPIAAALTGSREAERD